MTEVNQEYIDRLLGLARELKEDCDSFVIETSAIGGLGLTTVTMTIKSWSRLNYLLGYIEGLEWPSETKG